MLLFQNPDGRFGLTLEASHRETMASYCWRDLRMETGGILIGHYDDELRIAHLTEVTGPPLDSRAAPTWFERGIVGINSLLRKVESNRGDHYLGEWHFHPSGLLAPSPKDINRMVHISASRKYSCSEPLLIIAGHDCATSDGQALMRAFVFPLGQEWQELRPVDKR